MSKTSQLNQRIVYAGLLRTNIDRGALKSAFEHWNKGNSEVPVDIFDVVDNIVDYIGLGVPEKKALTLGLHTASSELYNDLKPVPEFILGEQASDVASSDAEPQTSEAPQQAAHLNITSRYLQAVSLQIKRNDASTHKELVQAVADEGLLSGLSREVSDWAADNLNAIKLGASVTVEQCQELAHEFYVMVCDFIGPVEIDIIVNNVISDLAKSSEARDFNPQKLL